MQTTERGLKYDTKVEQSKIELFQDIKPIDFDELFKNKTYSIPNYTINLKQFGPDFTKSETLEYFKQLLLNHPAFKAELLGLNNIDKVLRKDRFLFQIILFRLRNQRFKNPINKKLAKDFLNNQNLPGASNNCCDIAFNVKNGARNNSLNLDLYFINFKDINPLISFSLDKDSSKLTLQFLYPDLLNLGLAGFGDQFILLLFKSILNSRYIAQFTVENPVSPYWSRFPIDNPLNSYKNSLNNSKFSTKENTLSKTDIKLWLYTRGYLSKSNLEIDDLSCKIDPKKVIKTDLEIWLE